MLDALLDVCEPLLSRYLYLCAHIFASDRQTRGRWRSAAFDTLACARRKGQVRLTACGPARTTPGPAASAAYSQIN
jgi:hypothetical protein